ncbi:ER membrane protein complex subunit 4 [Fusarium oxysporum f. sp. albedinis]|nr:ER membrane protein complex subunit 4 [Fusarium oxysporum f. sp. albedinis]
MAIQAILAQTKASLIPCSPLSLGEACRQESRDRAHLREAPSAGFANPVTFRGRAYLQLRLEGTFLSPSQLYHV